LLNKEIFPLSTAPWSTETQIHLMSTVSRAHREVKAGQVF
jgi:hypothetical protein